MSCEGRRPAGRGGVAQKFIRILWVTTHLHLVYFSLILEQSPQGFVFMINSPWWKPAVEIFSQVSGYIVAPIIVALIAGKALDSHFGTEPWIFLALAGLGFVVSCVGIYRVIKSYGEKLKDLNQNDK